jgi:hypothetical protein
MEEKKEKEPFLYIIKFRTAVYSFVLFILLSNKIAFNVLNTIITSLFNKIEILNDKNDPTPLAIFIMAIIFALFIFIF